MYRIYTEDVNKQGIESILDKLFPGYTVAETDGVWQGKHERSLAIDIETSDANKVKTASSEIKKLNSQDAVLVEDIASHAELI